MRKMLLAILASSSLVLAVIGVAAWVYSYQKIGFLDLRADGLSQTPPRWRSVSVASVSGSLGVQGISGALLDQTQLERVRQLRAVSARTLDLDRSTRPSTGPWRFVLLVHSRVSPEGHTARYVRINLPHAVVVAAAAVLPALWGWRRWRRRPGATSDARVTAWVRLRRWAAITGAAACLVAFVAVGTLLVVSFYALGNSQFKSYSVVAGRETEARGRSVEGALLRGRFAVFSSAATVAAGEVHPGRTRAVEWLWNWEAVRGNPSLPRGSEGTVARALGFAYDVRPPGKGGSSTENWMFIVPLYPAAIALGSASAWIVWRGCTAARVRRRTERGLCPSCGYDVRASPEQCPECGRVVRQPPAAAAPGVH